MKKKTKGIITGVIALSVVGSILSPDKKIESIELSIPNYQAEYDINANIPIDISVSPENTDTSSLEYITSGDTIAFSDAGIITGTEEGTYEIYVASGDIRSDILTINVVDITAREEEIAKAEEERLAKEREAEEQKLAEELAAKEAELQRLTEELEAKEKEADEAEQEAMETPITKEPEKQEAAEKQADEKTEEPKQPESEQAEPKQAAQVNTDNAVSSGDGSNFNTYDNASQQNTEATYVLNTSTKKIHHPSCDSVKKIAPQNYSTSNSSIDELKAQGYSTCGNCF